MKLNIGEFFQEWNEKAGHFKFSSTRLQMFGFAIFDMFFLWQYFISEGNSITANSLVLIVILLFAAYSPKAIKDFANKKL